MKSPLDGWDADEREALEALGTDLAALQAQHAGDPPLDLLRAGRHDALPPDLQADAAGFIATSAWSRSLLEGVDGAETSLSPQEEDRLLARIQRSATVSAAPRWRWLRPALPAAALAAVAVLALWGYRGTSQPASLPAEPPRQSASAPPAREHQLPLDPPEVLLSTAALTWRGAASENPLLADLKPAVDAFRQGDYARAGRAFAALERRHPSSVEVHYYGGVARLFLNDFTGAIGSLERAAPLADAGFSPEIEWYRAVAEQRAGRTADSRARLENLCRGRTSRAAPACAALAPADPR